MGIQIRIRIRILTLMRMRIRIQTHEKVLKYAHISYIFACHLQTDADSDFYLTRMRIHGDPEADPDPQH
jgi:hypothetical protein